jgi:hypothetical protein
MSPVDAAWYHMDGTAHPGLVTGVALTAQPLSITRIRVLWSPPWLARDAATCVAEEWM